jgi:hypothetical protein
MRQRIKTRIHGEGYSQANIQDLRTKEGRRCRKSNEEIV